MSKTTLRIHLKQFTKDQLIFSSEEARDILIFFFPGDRAMIVNATITDSLRGFAQSLLVAAVDASYKIGWIEALWKSTAFPGPGMSSAIKKLARNAATQWLKNITNKGDILDAKIYENVRVALGARFRSALVIRLVAKSESSPALPFATTVNIRPESTCKAWG